MPQTKSLSAFLGKFGPWFLILLPALGLAHLLSTYLVNIPFMDDWMFTPMYEKARGMHDGFTLHDFFIVQMEHRLAWPRIVIVTLDHFFPGKFIAQCWFTFFLMSVTLMNIGILLKRTGRPFQHWWPILAIASAIIFSPVQYQILLWPMMFQVATPVAGLTTAMVALGSKLPLWLRLVIAVLGALAGSLSIASGLLVWLLIIPVIIWAKQIPNGKPRLFVLAGWMIAFIVTAVLYFHDLKNETDPQFSYRAGKEEVTTTRGLGALISNPTRVIAFTCEFVGGYLCRGTSGSMRVLSTTIGALSLAVILASFCYWLKQYRKSPFIKSELVPWIALALYAPGTGMLVALGRAWATASGDNSLQARYVIHAVPLTISLVVLTWLIFGHLAETRPHWKERLMKLRTVLATAIVMILGLNWMHGRFMMETWSSSRLRASANTHFFKLRDQGLPHLINTKCEFASNHPLAGRMNDIGLITPPMATSTRLDQFDISKRSLSSNTAHIETMRILRDTNPKKRLLLAQGEAALPAKERVADAVVFARRDPSLDNDPWTIFHVGHVMEMPMTLNSTLGRDMRFLFLPEQELSASLAQFSLEIPLEALPNDQKTYVVTAYALDFRRMRLYPMEGLFKVNLSIPSVSKISGKSKSNRPETPADELSEADAAKAAEEDTKATTEPN